MYFVCECGEEVKANIIAVNEPRTLKIIVPQELEPQGNYRLKLVTQSSVKNGGSLLKNIREIQSEFTLTAQQV